jgi:hypothetical protein
MNVGYSDFRHLCEVDDTEEWVPWLSVRGDGVYVKTPPAGILASEAAALSDHPTGNLSEPALRFPCTLSELDSFLTKHGQHPCIDAFVMAKWVQEQTERRGVTETPLHTGQPPPTDGAVSVTLPHLPKALAAVFLIMRNNWTDYDPKRPPKQVNIAREIDTAIGWKAESDGAPSRNAKTIAALIKPDAINDTE